MPKQDYIRGLVDAAESMCPYCRARDQWNEATPIDTPLLADGIESRLTIIGHTIKHRIGLESGGIALCTASPIIGLIHHA